MHFGSRYVRRSTLLQCSRANSHLESVSRWQLYRGTLSKVFCPHFIRSSHNLFESLPRSISTFRYKPLRSAGSNQPSMRLLELRHGRDQSQIEGSLKEVSLSSKPQYEAVSYCWGDSKDVSTILCNGQQLKVPRQLDIALRNMRFCAKPRTLWADAICINQSDNSEKESQVQLMRTIFSNAQRTLIFLGDSEAKEATKMSKFALWSIQLGLSIFRRRVKLLTNPRIRVLNIQDDEGRCHTVAPYSYEFYLELIGMLRMPWFQRAWVVQEVAVSTKATIFWGDTQYDWGQVIRALKFMSQFNFPLAFIVTLENISTIAEEQGFYRHGRSKLNDVLLRHQRCLATDPRDKIYSFCGLVGTSSTKNSVRISYEDNVATIYREVALKILSDDQSLDLLSRPPSLSHSRMSNLPSWVPDWSISSASTLTYAWGHGPLPLAGAALHSAGKSKLHRFSASRWSQYTPTLADPNTLVVSGYEFEKIVETGPAFKGVQIPHTVRSLPEIFLEWARCLTTLAAARNVFVRWQPVANVKSPARYQTGETMREAFLQTLSASELHDSERVRIELELWEKGTSFPLGLMYSMFVLMRNFVMNKPFLLFEIQGRYALHRRVVRTERGYLGLASNAAEVGDCVVLCRGSRVPLIMRKCTGGGREDEFRLVGDAYVHGVMRGEAFEDDRCRDIRIR